MKIAVDAMGGDNAPQVVVEGIVASQKDYPEMQFILYGDEEKIRQYLPSEVKNIEVVHTTEKINSDDEPVKAVRKKKDASMVLAAQAVKNGEADALLSAGNTGALLVAGLFIVGRLKGIDRPALMPTLPVLNSDQGFNFLDVGANADSKAIHLYQQAILGSYYAQNVRGLKNPTIGLLNNGTEANKGNEVTKKAHELLSQAEGINFIGNVEARDLLDGVADVVVTDGFTGNAVLKTIEGTAMSMMKLIKGAIMDSGIKGKLGGLMLKDSLGGLKTKMDYSQYGGAVLIGLAAPVVKTHGSATPEAFVVCVKQLHEMLSSHIIEDMKTYFESHEIEEAGE